MQPGDEVQWVDPEQVDYHHPDSSPVAPVWQPGVLVGTYDNGELLIEDARGFLLDVPPQYARSAPRLPL